MGSTSLECGICSEPFDPTEHVPIFLPACGHTFCRPCLLELRRLSQMICCPLCRVNHDGDNMPVNWVLLDLIRDQSQSQSANSTEDEGARRESNNVQRESNDSVPQDGSQGSDGDGSNTSSTDRKNKILKGTLIGLGALVGAVGAVAAVPVVLTGVGFTSPGIAAGSWAAGMMSSAAIANGGGVAAGSLVAILQGAGAAGIGAGAAAGVATAGGAAGMGIAAGANRLFGKNGQPEQNTGGNDGSNNGNSGGGNDDNCGGGNDGSKNGNSGGGNYGNNGGNDGNNGGNNDGNKGDEDEKLLEVSFQGFGINEMSNTAKDTINQESIHDTSSQSRTIRVSSDDGTKRLSPNCVEMADDGSSASKTYPCPVCSELFSESQMNQHLDSHFS